METKIIQITSGKGPRECEWVVAKTLTFFLDDLARHDAFANIIAKEDGETRSEIQSVQLEIRGENLDDFIHEWVGTIQWVGQSPFRKNHKRRNWFVGIFEISDNNTLIFNENEVVYQTMRSSGAGGQHVNKVSSAVRAIHKPSAIVVVSSESRSQLQNRKLALTRLKNKLAEMDQQKKAKDTIERWSNHLSLQRGNPIKTFKGERFKLI